MAAENPAARLKRSRGFVAGGTLTGLRRLGSPEQVAAGKFIAHRLFPTRVVGVDCKLTVLKNRHGELVIAVSQVTAGVACPCCWLDPEQAVGIGPWLENALREQGWKPRR